MAGNDAHSVDRCLDTIRQPLWNVFFDIPLDGVLLRYIKMKLNMSFTKLNHRIPKTHRVAFFKICPAVLMCQIDHNKLAVADMLQ